MNSDPAEPVAPELLAGRYELLEEVGRGAMGVVHRAFDREARRAVALKALHGADPDDLYRLKSEFRALAGVLHPHLVRLYEMSVEGERGFFTMELIEGGRTLPDYLSAATVAASDLRGAFGQLASALAALHEAGWLHRDLKPSNVLVGADGRVVLLDFGLVRGLRAELAQPTQVGAIVGTLAYMSPEQALGQALTPASDWYSFGVLLYECLTGHSPLEHVAPALLFDRDRIAIPPVRTLSPESPPDLAALAEGLLAALPAHRPDPSRVFATLGGAATRVATTALARGGPFVGRKRELTRLQKAWDSMLGGGVSVAALEGSSGLGKSSLVERFLASLPTEAPLVLRARCHPHETVPFEALDEVVDALSDYLASLASARIDALLPRDTTALRIVFPVLGRVALPPARGSLASEAEPHELRRRGFEALRELLARIADRRPVVVWVDDLQWADADSVPLLRELLRPPDAPAILWLFSFRGEDRDHSPLLQDLDKLLELVPAERRHGMALQPLSVEESRELVELMAEAPLGLEAADLLAVESRGSPFLLTELVRTSGEGEPEPSARNTDVGQVVQRRLAGLPGEGRRLLESISVAGGPLDRSVALEAAGLEALDPDLLMLLEGSRLLRSAASSRSARLEIYHDQIREAIDRGLSPGDRGARHLGIANALERSGSRDVAALSMHHAGAGQRAPAARYAVLAGEQAEQQLAFDQAARFFHSALELDRSAVDVASTYTRLGEALANAGRGAQAAAAFETAAAETPRTEAEPLRQRAAEQFLVSGRVEEGKRILIPLLASHGVRYPGSAAGVAVRTLALMPRLAWRYWRGSVTPDAAAEPATKLRVDACQTAAQGLVVVDPTRAVYFAIQSLLHTLRGGDAYRTGRALTVVSVTLLPLGGIPAAWAASMLAWAERLAAAIHDPRLDGMVAVTQAQAEFVSGRFASMLEICDEGARLLVERCRGMRWYSNVAQMAALRALEELGRIAELRRRIPRLIDEAVSLDDRYAEVTFRLYDAYWMISSGRIEDARRSIDDTLSRWGGEGYQLQHLYALRVLAWCDVYVGEPQTAWERVQRDWPSLERSGLLRHQMLRGDALLLRARAALAAFGDRALGPLEREVTRCASALDALKRADSIAAADLLRAAMAMQRGGAAEALPLLTAAHAGFESADMLLHAAYTQRRQGELIGGPEGEAWVTAADGILADAGIVDPSRWLETQAPGFRPRAS